MTACAEHTLQELDWPNELPTYDTFLDDYRRDPTNARYQTLAQYLSWVKRFYLGWELYPRGWVHLSQDLLFRIDDPLLAAELKDRLANLSAVIASEWAKDNRVRHIDTRQVSIWGNALLTSLRYGETLSIPERVTEDVHDLLNNRISSEVITENRFYAEEDIFSEID